MGSLVPTKYDLVGEGARWLAEWLEKSDPGFKGVSIILITVSDGVFDMVSNEPPERIRAMLTSGMLKVLTMTPTTEIGGPKSVPS